MAQPDTAQGVEEQVQALEKAAARAWKWNQGSKRKAGERSSSSSSDSDCARLC